jgi:tetratricopeptide (TPR) repeat protein
MQALVASGDRASALAHARAHEALVRRELDADLDPAVQSLVRALRARSVEPPPAPQLLGSSPPSAAAPTSPPPDGTVAATVVPSGGRRRQLVLGVITVAALVTIALLWRDRSGPANTGTPILAVGTIRTSETGDSGSVGLVLRDLLATTLGGQHDLQVVANSRLVELTPPADVEEAGAITDAARRAGATEVIEGELTSEGESLVLTLRRVDIGRGVVRRGYVVRADNRFALVDSAAAAVTRDLGLSRPSLPAREVRTASSEAYLLYNEGLRAYYGFDGPAAHRLMHAALDRDSSFAMAAYYAWLIGEGVTDPAANRREFDRVKHLAAGTIERERLLIQTELARREAPIHVAAALADTLTVRYPNDPDGLVVLGQVRFDAGDFQGSVAAFRQAFLVDSIATIRGPFCRLCAALGLMINAYQWWDSTGAAERVGRLLIALRPDDPVHWSTLAETLLRLGRRDEAEAALTRSGSMSLPQNVGTSMLNRDLIRWGRYDELDQRLRLDILSPRRETRADGRWLLTLSLRDQGRLREALSLAREGRIPGTTRTVPDPTPEWILSAMLIADLGRPDSAARSLHREAQQTLASQDLWPGQRARRATWYLTLAGTAYAAAGDTASVRQLADSTEALGRQSTFGRDIVLHHFLRGLLLQREGRHAEAVDAFRRSSFSMTDGYTQINLALARSLLVLGRPEEAIAVLRPAIHGGVDGSNSYTSRTELHEVMAEAFDQTGQRDSARAHYVLVERGWRRADPEYTRRYLRAQTALQAPGR